MRLRMTNLKRNVLRLRFRLLDLKNPRKPGTTIITGLKPLALRIPTEREWGHGFILKIILNGLPKECIPTMERKQEPGNTLMMTERHVASRTMKPEKCTSIRTAFCHSTFF